MKLDSVDQYQELIEHSSDIITLIDSDGVIHFQSPSIERVLGYDSGDLVGNDFLEYIHPDDQSRISKRFYEFLESSAPSIEEVEYRFQHANGSWVWLESTASHLSDSNLDGCVVNSRDVTNRRIREKRLQQTSARWGALYENSPDMIDLLGPEGKLLDVNARFCEELGYAEEELLGRPIWEIDVDVSEDDVPSLLADFEMNERRKFEGTYERKDGSTFPVEVHLLRLDIEGEDRYMAISRDITERKEYENTIRVLHEEAQDIFQAETSEEVADIIVDAVQNILGLAINGVALYDENEHVLRTVAMTDSARELFGEPPVFRPGESIAWEVFEAGKSASYDDVSTMDGRLNPDTAIRSEITVPLGEWGIFSVGSTESGVFSDVDRSLIEILATHAETALERIERERALERSEDRYRSLTDDVLDTSSVGTFILDSNFEVVWINEATEEFFGIDRAKVIGADKRQLIHDHIKHIFEDAEAFAETVLATYDDNTYVEEFECHVLSGENRQGRWLNHWSQPIDSGLYEGGRIEHYTDITARKRREQTLERQNERLDEFASVVSHDLRNPLSVAEGRLELLSDEYDSEHVEPIERALDRMEALIEDLLTLAREGESITDLEPVDIASLADDCWANVETDEARLVVETGQIVQADKSRLKQLFENLMRNAIEHGDETVTVTIGALDDGFYIEDDGPGIPPDERDDIFEAGYSASAEGTGFGLSIVKRIAEAHGWDIRVTNGVEGGARFEITGVEHTTE